MINRDELTRLIHENFPFGEFREHQEDAILQTVGAYLQGRKYVVIESPTGSGKSVIAYTACKVIQELYPFTERRSHAIDKGREPGPYSVATVQTRALQIQYDESFSDMPLLWSATNFECAAMPYEPEAHWGAWNCKKMKCDYINQCAFNNAKEKFFDADIGITNYAYFLHQRSMVPAVVVIDETHNLEEALCSWMTITLSKKVMPGFFDQLLSWKFISEEQWDDANRILLQILSLDPSREHWFEILKELAKLLSKIAATAYINIQEYFDICRNGHVEIRTETGKQMTKLSSYFRNLTRTLGFLAKTETEWVVSDRECEDGEPFSKTETIHFKPLFINEISQNFFQQAEFFILMSATICGHENMMKYLGVEEDEYHYIDVPPTIPIEQRPVYMIKNVGKLVYSNKQTMLPKFVNYMDSIIEAQFEGVRGIVHSVSYENAEFIKNNSRLKSRMRFPETEQLTEVIQLLESESDTIVVSPSIVEGLDLKDNLCRFSFFFKVPWAPLSDEWVKRRKEDQKWYARNAAVKVVQGSGRGTRSKEDHSITIILDASFLHIWYSHQDVLPRWFVDSVQLVKI